MGVGEDAIASLPLLPKLWKRQSDKAMCRMKEYAIALSSPLCHPEMMEAGEGANVFS